MYLARKAKRNKAVAAVTKALARHRVAYQATGVAHVVLITPASQPPVYLSLKSQPDEAGYTVYRYRLAETGTWQTMRRDAFFTWVHASAPPRPTGVFTPVQHMPFGQFKGRLISDLVPEHIGYLRWLSEEATFVADNLRQTITGLLQQQTDDVVRKE